MDEVRLSAAECGRAQPAPATPAKPKESAERLCGKARKGPKKQKGLVTRETTFQPAFIIPKKDLKNGFSTDLEDFYEPNGL